MAERTDEELARAGDREAYGRLVTRYQGHVYGLAWSIAPLILDARDRDAAAADEIERALGS